MRAAALLAQRPATDDAFPAAIVSPAITAPHKCLSLAFTRSVLCYYLLAANGESPPYAPLALGTHHERPCNLADQTPAQITACCLLRMHALERIGYSRFARCILDGWALSGAALSKGNLTIPRPLATDYRPEIALSARRIVGEPLEHPEHASSLAHRPRPRAVL